MSSPPNRHPSRDNSHDSVDDAEKGMYDSATDLTAPPPFAYVAQDRTDLSRRSDSRLSPTSQLSPVPEGILSPVHEGITPRPSVPDLSLSWPADSPAARRGSVNAAELKTTVAPPKPAPKKRKVPRWILIDLWFNTYRKFFTLITLLNLVGIIMAAIGRFPYAENHLGALVLGNLLCAVLFRNELWMRFLYLVCIYGLGPVRVPRTIGNRIAVANKKTVGTTTDQIRSYIGLTTCRRYPLGMRSFRISVRHPPIYILGTTDSSRWLVYKIVDIIRYRAVQHPAVIASGIITNVFIIISVLSAFPWIRK